MHPKITSAHTHDDYTITLTFQNREQRRFDMTPYLDSEVFAPLKDLTLFHQVRVVFGSLEWPGERDLASDMLYLKSEPLETPVS